MRFQHSVLHQLLKLVPWGEFDRLVDEHGADRRVRQLSTRDQFVALLYGQLAGASSLREIETALLSHRSRLYHLGAHDIARSTLADANAKRPALVFSGLFQALLAQADRRTRRTMNEALRLIDSTTVSLAGVGSAWARFSGTLSGIKAHVVYDPEASCPLYAAVTPCAVNDITAAKAIPIEPGATYVFDLGYYDYAWWAALQAQECRIVTRFKTSTPLHDPLEWPLEPGTPVLSDRIGFLPRRQAKNRKNPMDEPVREVRVKTETGKVLRLLTNDLSATAEEIAALYKRRWHIELFFRWVKQVLKIKHLIGRSENAVRIQIATALIAFLLLRLLQSVIDFKQGPLVLARLIRTNLMHCRDITTLLNQPDRTAPPLQTSSPSLSTEPDSRGLVPVIHAAPLASFSAKDVAASLLAPESLPYQVVGRDKPGHDGQPKQPL